MGPAAEVGRRVSHSCVNPSCLRARLQPCRKTPGRKAHTALPKSGVQRFSAERLISSAPSPHDSTTSPVLEVLDRTLVLLRRLACCERPQVPPSARLLIGMAAIDAKFTGFELSNHVCLDGGWPRSESPQNRVPHVSFLRHGFGMGHAVEVGCRVSHREADGALPISFSRQSALITNGGWPTHRVPHSCASRMGGGLDSNAALVTRLR